jgi:chemotaxis protein methyltransferase CheR
VDDGLPLSPQVFAILAGLVEERAGITYGPEQRDLLADRASSRAVERGLGSLLDYYYLLRYDDPTGAETQLLVESLLVHESFFFRELDGLEAVVERVIEPLVRAGGPRVRMWSAACATGEEPVTLAMLLAERGLLAQVELVATDLSRRALERARSGRFGRRSLRHPPPRELGKLLRQDGAEVVAAPELLAAIDFRQLNLLDAAGIAALGAFDAILCRNVLIYFRDATARAVVASLTDRLRPGGALLVGVSESLLRFDTSLVFEERGGAFLYRKGPHSAPGRPR